MDTNKSLIIAAVAIVAVIIAGVALSGNHSPEPVEQVGDTVKAAPNNVSAYEIPLRMQNFTNFDILAPEGSDFIQIGNLSDTDKGMKTYQNIGNHSGEVYSLTIDKNMTDSLIPSNVDLVKDNDTKVYSTKNAGQKVYYAVKTVNDTDIIVSGHNLQIIEKMLNNTTVKDTGDLMKKAEPAPVKKVVTPKPKKTQVETKSKPAPKDDEDDGIKKTTYPLIIGGGMFETGSELEDLTYAKIYVGPEHAGETIKIKILYSRDGEALNTGNLVTTTVEGDGYIHIASADAYSKFPDYAIVKVYDWQGDLQNTQEISLEPKSGTQYF